MATLDQLNFEVIISDKKFDAQIKDIENKARQFNTSLSNILNIRRVSTQMSQQDVENARRVGQAKVDEARAQEKINREKIKTEGLQRKINAQIDRANRGYNQQSRILNELKSMALGYLSIQGAQKLLTSLVRVTGEFELQKTTLAAMLGDLNAAENVISKIQGLAVESPFQFKELTTYAKQLSAFSVPAQELYDTTKMLADISAGLGVGMDRIVLAYGQVRSAAFLRGQEVRQFTEAGIPILNELAKQFTELEGRAVSTTEVFDKISKRLVPFEMVAKVFKDMTSEGGKFYNMQEVQAETLKGKISNLTDAYEVMLNEIGKSQSENLKGAVDWARKLMQNYEETGRAILELVAAYGLYKAALITLTLATGTFNIANHKLLNSLVNAAKWAAKNPYVIIAAGLTAIGYAVYKNITALEPYEKIMKSLEKTNNDFLNSMTSETAKLDTLYARLELAKEGTEEYAKARKAIYSQYANYISELENEGIAVDNLANIYDKLKLKIIDSQKARFREVASTDLNQNFEEQTSSLLKEAEKATERLVKKTALSFSALEKEAVQAYVAGTLSKSDIEGDERLKTLATVLKYSAESGSRAWQQFGTSIENAKADFELATAAYAEGLDVIEQIYGKAEDSASKGLNPFVYDLESGGAGGKSPAQKAIEERIKSIQKLKDAYEKLLPFLNDVQMKESLKNLFPNIESGVIDSLAFDVELEKLADKLEEFDEDAAQRLRDSIGKDVAGMIADSFKAVEQYKKMLDSWLGEDFNLSGEGVMLDFSKIISNLNNEYSKIDQKRAKTLDLLRKAQLGDEMVLYKVRTTLGEDVWKKYIEEGESAIDLLTEKEKLAAKQVAEERIRDLANKYVSEKMFEKNIDLSELDEKTISQVQEQINRLEELRDAVNDEIQKLGDVEPGTLGFEDQSKIEMLTKVLDLLGIKINDTKEDLDKKLTEGVVKATEAVSELGGQISSLGDAMGNSNISEFGESISGIAKGISSIVSALQAKDTVALIANMVSLLVERITNVMAAYYEYQRMLSEATGEYESALLRIRREVYSGVFGTDEMGLAAENAKILTEAQEKLNDSLEKMNDIKLRGQKDNGGIMFRKVSVTEILEDISKGQGWDLNLSNGELNYEAIEAYFDSYANRLTRKQRKLVEELIESNKALNDAAAQQAQYLTDLYSNVADTISSKMVDAFIESGSAAIDMGEIVSDTAKEMVADLIKSLYILPILNQYRAKATAIDTNAALPPEQKTEALLNLLDTALQQIALQEDDINNTLERFTDYFKSGEEEEIGGLGEGIKGITEDQANLLASYLNAIRADVSYSKTLWARMDANLQKLADMLVTSPTLMEYQAQIAANTYDTAVASQQILAELRSVITFDGGDGAIRTHS